MEIWDNTKGLPQNAVFALEKDNYGYLWIATEEGLVRLDGTFPKVFDQGSNPNMLEQTYYTFFKTPKGLWATADRSIVLLEKTIQRVIDCTSITENTWIRAITETENGDLLIGTQSGKIHRYREGKFEQLPFWNPQLPMEINGFFSNSSTSLLVGTTRGLYELDLKNQKSTLRSPDSLSFQKIFGENKSLFVSVADEGIFSLDENFDLIPVISYRDHRDINPASLSIDSENRIWAGSIDKGLMMIEKGVVTRFTYPELKNYTIRKIIKEGNNIYLGTLGKGLAIVKPAKVKQLKFDALSEKNIKAIFQDQDSSIWIGTRSEGVHRIRNNEILSLTTKEGLIQNGVTTLGASGGKIYVGSNTGISVIDKKSSKVVDKITREDGLKSDYIYVVYEDSRGWIWILTRYGGIHYLDDNGQLRLVDLPKKYDQTSFISILELKNGQILVGSMNQGVFRLDQGKLIENKTLPLTPGEDVIYDIHEDESGDLWFGTHGGIILWTSGGFKAIKKSNGIKSQSVYSITQDPVNGIWISNNFGVQYFSDSELAYFKESTSQDFFLASTFYDQRLGMPNSETNGLIYPSAIRDFSGKIWIPTVDGVGIIDPFSISSESANPTQFVWDEVIIGDQIIPIQGDVNIPSGVRMFQVSFSLIDFENPSQYSLFYRIDSKSGHWLPIKDQRQLNFNGLKPGDHTLDVIILRYGQTEMTQTLNFHVEATFFETPIFWIIIALASILLVYFGFQAYFNQKLKNELEVKVEKRTLELRQTNLKLTEALKEIEDQNELLKEITWNQSHLVRAPLTKAMGITNLLLKYPTYSNVGKTKEELEQELLETLKQLDQIVKETHSIAENLKKHE